MPTKKNPAPTAPEVEPAATEAAPIGSFEAYGRTWTVVKRPSLLLLAEMGRTDSGDPSAVAVIADLFENTLGKTQYHAFRTHAYAAETDEEMTDCIGKVLEVLAPATPTA